jgi:hypothetical protein
MTVPPMLERSLFAYMPGADREDQPENIHTDKVAKALGYRGALVYGTTVHAWSVPLVVEALGDDWMRDGWVDLSIRRPIYTGERLHITLEPGEAGAFLLGVRGDDGGSKVAGVVAKGTGAWTVDHVRSKRLEVESLPNPRPLITLETAPVGEDLPCLRAEPHDRLASLFEEATEYERGALLAHGRRVLSPAAISGRMTWYVHAVWDYAGPALHTNSQVQYLDFVDPNEPLTVAGHFRDAFERNGHHYSVTDGTVFGADGREVALTRHSSIFKVAKQESR